MYEVLCEINKLIGQSNAVIGKKLRALWIPEAYRKRSIGAIVELKIQPMVERINSALRSWVSSPTGLIKKKSGKVAMINQYTINIIDPIKPVT